MTMFARLYLLVVPAITLPSGNLRIIFDEQKVPSLSGHQCAVEAGEVHWPEDGGCYVLGERGPCQPGHSLQLVNSRPGCGPDPGSEAESHPVQPCEGTEGSEGVLWTDGECYQLASTGPCLPGHWLVLAETGDSVHCQQRSCPEEEVWWSPSCSCFPSTFNQTLRFKSDLEWPCGENERLLVSPYGDGVCAIQDLRVRLFELLSSSSIQSSEAATRKNCFLDERGRCRKTLNIRGKIDLPVKENDDDDDADDYDDNDNDNVDDYDNNDDKNEALQDIFTWLEKFPKPSHDCEAKAVEEEVTKIEEPDCYKEGKILYEDGRCYNLLERGPCSEETMWLVMVVQADGVSLAAECRQRTCMETIWDPQSCQCSSGEESSCGPGERLYEDIFGSGVCGCREGHEVWAETGECHQVGERGPCNQGETFSYDPLSQVTQCREGGPARVFDIIPSTGQNNIQNINKVTKETCILDSKGRCRRKITVNRASTVDRDSSSQSEEFEAWLESFLVRSPETFNCTDSSR